MDVNNKSNGCVICDAIIAFYKNLETQRSAEGFAQK